MKKTHRFKRSLALVLALCMVLALTACGNSGGGGAGAAGGSGGSGGSGGDKIPLTIWHIQTGGAAEAIQGSVDRFVAENPQYDVTVVQKQNDSYKTDLSLAINAGTMPDVFITWGGQTMYDYVDEGLIYDLTDLMKANNYAGEFLDAAIAQCSYNDKIYAVPVENISVAGFFYNKEVFDQFGLSEPATVADLESICDTLVANDVYPFALANATQWTGSMYFQYLATRHGGLEPFADAAAGTGSFENDSFVYAGQTIQDWVDKGYFCDGFNGMDDDSGQARMLFYSGDAAMDLMGSWFISNVADESDMLEENTLGYFPFPALDGSSADQSLVLGTLGDNLYSVSTKSADPEGAFKLIQFLLDEQAQTDRIAQGKIIPLKDFTSDNPVTNEVLEALNSSGGVQLWYDQYLPAEVADVHKRTSQAIFGETTTPEQANADLQAAMEAYLAG